MMVLFSSLQKGYISILNFDIIGVLMLQLRRFLECHRQINVRLSGLVWVCIILKISSKKTAKFMYNLVTKQFPNDVTQTGLSELFYFSDFND